jgi:hypothetical protein
VGVGGFCAGQGVGLAPRDFCSPGFYALIVANG